ncbi:MAG: hypothetical protein J6034_01295 [Bacteroidaceae bacterium]|jgi:hypothetical protein|nr:hypothetical protein [Bacteroidaceae bacterium]
MGDMTIWDKLPDEQKAYLSKNGKHFNKKLCEFAVSKMRMKEGTDGKTLPPYTREDVEAMLLSIGVKQEKIQAPYDAVYVANMAKSDFYGSSLEDKEHIAKYVADVLFDMDGYDGMVMNRWLADMACKGIWIDWEMMI